ncbi:MAG: hypothetical protein QG670_2677 [Thermoproteota archaeon]|nr:hypothetical protein [Thermoproteota archaeon]
MLNYDNMAKKKPKRFEIDKFNHKLVFECDDGQKYEFACEDCKRTTWDITNLKDEKNRAAIYVECSNCHKDRRLIFLDLDKSYHT